MKKLIWSATPLMTACAAQAEATTVATDNLVQRSPFSLPGMWWGLLALTALIGAGIVVGILRAQIKTAAKKHGASGYMQEDSFHLHVNVDHFLYRTQTKRKIEPKKED